MSDFTGKCEIRTSEQLGRHLVAVRDIRRGELLLCEQPAIIGPTWNATLSCQSCFGIVNLDVCKKCHTANLCANCEQHDEVECETFKKLEIDRKFLQENANIVTPLKVLILKNKDRPLYDELMLMEAHLQERENTDLWNYHKKYVVIPLLERIRTTNYDQDIDEVLLQKICGILDVNTFEIRGDTAEDGAMTPLDSLLRGLYPKAALLAHDCIGNTTISVDSTFNLRIHASLDIKEGEMIYYNYTNALYGTNERRQHLKEGKYFTCNCKRCSDPTELGTHMNTFSCPSCTKGQCVQETEEKQWKCLSCQHILTGEHVESVLKAAREKIGLAGFDIKEIERQISIFSEILYPTHWMIVEAKQNLAALLRSICMMEDTVKQPPKKYLQRKLVLCEELIPLLRIVTPGISRFTGIALYENHISILQLSQRNYDSGEINTEKLLENLLSAEAILKEAINLLLYEHPSTQEGKLMRQAMMGLKDLRGQIIEVRDILADEQREQKVKAAKSKKNNKKKK